MITDSNARRIAAEWHGGQTSALMSLATTGAILPGVEVEINGEIEAVRNWDDVADLFALADYISQTGPRSARGGWHLIRF